MKKSFKNVVSESTKVFVVDYWFNYDDPSSLVVKVFKFADEAFNFLHLLESLGFQKYTFSIAYWKGYFEDNHTFIHED